MNYYDDTTKITFDKADTLVERYIREKVELRTRVTSKDVAREYDVEPSTHNLWRLNSALGERLEVSRPSGAKATQFIL